MVEKRFHPSALSKEVDYQVGVLNAAFRERGVSINLDSPAIYREIATFRNKLIKLNISVDSFLTDCIGEVFEQLTRPGAIEKLAGMKEKNGYVFTALRSVMLNTIRNEERYHTRVHFRPQNQKKVELSRREAMKKYASSSPSALNSLLEQFSQRSTPVRQERALLKIISAVRRLPDIQQMMVYGYLQSLKTKPHAVPNLTAIYREAMADLSLELPPTNQINMNAKRAFDKGIRNLARELGSPQPPSKVIQRVRKIVKERKSVRKNRGTRPRA